jgi:hypothetical protein
MDIHDDYFKQLTLDNSLFLMQQLRQLKWVPGRIYPEKIWKAIGEDILPGENSKLVIKMEGEGEGEKFLPVFHEKQTTASQHGKEKGLEEIMSHSSSFDNFDFDKILSDFKIFIVPREENQYSFVYEYTTYPDETEKDLLEAFDLLKEGKTIDAILKEQSLSFFEKERELQGYSKIIYDPEYRYTKNLIVNNWFIKTAKILNHLFGFSTKWIEIFGTQVYNPIDIIHISPSNPSTLLSLAALFFHEIGHSVLGHSRYPNDKNYSEAEREFQATLISFICLEYLGYFSCQKADITLIYYNELEDGISYIKRKGVTNDFLSKESNKNLTNLVHECIIASDKIIRSGLSLSPPIESKLNTITSYFF